MSEQQQLDKAGRIAREIVQIANSPDLGDIRADAIERVINRELNGQNSTERMLAHARANAVVANLALTIITITDAIRSGDV